MSAEVLIVEDDAAMRRLLETFIGEIGHTVAGVGSGQEGIALYTELKPELVLLDIKLPDIDGLQVLKRLKALDPACRVVIMSSYSNTHTVAEAMKLGVENYLTKPTPLPELRVLIDKLLEKSPDDSPGVPLRVQGVIGCSEAMQEVFRMIRRVAKTKATVLVRGESGTGKEVIARAIHVLSASSPKAFVPVDCTNIPGNLMETELFGHERGAFTDAKVRKQGLVETASDGTLFLDEVGLLPLPLQAKLLNVLETQRFRRVGGTEQVQVSVRFVAATNENLEVAVGQGRFREDLYYRLNVVPIDLPPLRVRGDDVLLLARHYLELYASLHGTPPRRLGDEAVALLRSYSWPGNVRELKNVLERVVLMTDKRIIHAEDLVIDHQSERVFGDGDGKLKIDADGQISIVFPSRGLPLQKVEREVIQAALKHTKGNITKAAALLEVSRDQLRYRIAKYDLEVK